MRSCNEASRGILDNSNTAQVLSDIWSPKGVGQDRKEYVEIQMDFFLRYVTTGTDRNRLLFSRLLPCTNFPKVSEVPQVSWVAAIPGSLWVLEARRLHPLTSSSLHSRSKGGAKEHLLDKINKGMNVGRKVWQATYWAGLWSVMGWVGHEKHAAGVSRAPLMPQCYVSLASVSPEAQFGFSFLDPNEW